MKGEEQSAFLKALADGQAKPPPNLQHPFGGAAADRMAIYRNNFAFSLITALGEAYPLLADLLGRDAFIHLARDYMAAHPPGDPLMFRYGDKLPVFLQSYKALKHVPYAPDLAALEQAMNEAAHAKDHIVLSPSELADGQVENEKLYLAECLRLVVSPWPLIDLHAYVSKQALPPQDMSVAQSVLVYRDADYAVHPALLPLGGDKLLAALMDGQSLAKAAEVAQADGLQEAGMVEVFSLLVQNGLITGRAEISN